MPEQTVSQLIEQEAGKYVQELWDTYQQDSLLFRTRLLRYYKQYRGVPNRKNYDGLANVFVNETLEATEAIVAQIYHTIYSEGRQLMSAGREETDQKTEITDAEQTEPTNTAEPEMNDTETPAEE